MNELSRPQFLPDLLITALERNGDRPCLYVGDDVLTAAQMRDEISRYVQVFRTQGIRQGQGVATLAKNRPEVLCSMGAVMVSGCRNTPLHPLGSLDDHVYVLEDAGIDTLIFDPVFSERAQQLRERVPGLHRLLSYGETDVGADLVALAGSFQAERLIAPHVDPEDLSALAYTGGTTGKPKGVMNTYRGSALMAQIMASEWQWPDEVRHLVCTPLSHAGASLFVPLLLVGGSMVVLPAFEAGAVLQAIEEFQVTTTMLVPSMIYALLDHPDFAGPISRASRRSSTERRRSLRRACRRRFGNWARSSFSSTARPNVPRRSARCGKRTMIPTIWRDWLHVAVPFHGSRSPSWTMRAMRSRRACRVSCASEDPL